MRPLILVLLLAVACPVPSEACINGVRWSQDEPLRVTPALELLLRHEQWWLADLVLAGVGRSADGAEDDHLQDLASLVALRWRPDSLERYHAGMWFEIRWEQSHKPRYAAWFAEAAAADEPARALAMLRELARRDLMPDAHAYAALARLTSGPERIDAIERCYRMAAIPAICPARSVLI